MFRSRNEYRRDSTYRELDAGEMELREYVTVHDTDIDGPTDINANAYVENAVVVENVTVRYDVSLDGVEA
jgi:hypothetical protein